MKFQFKVNVNDDDYLNYNKFWMLRSPYGKKQVRSLRIFVALIVAVACVFVVINNGLNFGALCGVILLVILCTAIQLLLAPSYVLGLKAQISTMKKTGKPGYSPNSVMEFYDDYFVEITETNKTQQNYTSIERISIVDNKMIYIHVNNIMSYMLPLVSFESEEQYNEFLEFIKAKCSAIEVYEK